MFLAWEGSGAFLEAFSMFVACPMRALLLLVSLGALFSPTSQSATTTVHGRVVSAAGSPLSWVAVHLSANQDVLGPRIAVSDEQGEFSFRLEPSRLLYLTAVKPGFQSTRLGDVGLNEPALPLVPSRVSAPLQLVMPVGALVSGSVVDRRGVPVPDVPVSVYRRLRSGRLPDEAVATLRTDDLGRFRFAGLKSGGYVLRVSPPVLDSTFDTRLRYLAQDYPASSSVDPRAAVVARVGRRTEVKITLERQLSEVHSGDIMVGGTRSEAESHVVRHFVKSATGLSVATRVSPNSRYIVGPVPARVKVGVAVLGVFRDGRRSFGRVSDIASSDIVATDESPRLTGRVVAASGETNGSIAWSRLRLMLRAVEPELRGMEGATLAISDGGAFSGNLSVPSWPVIVHPAGSPVILKRILADGHLMASGMLVPASLGAGVETVLEVSSRVGMIVGRADCHSCVAVVLPVDRGRHGGVVLAQRTGTNGEFSFTPLVQGEYWAMGVTEFQWDEVEEPWVADVARRCGRRIVVSEGASTMAEVELCNVE